MSNINFIDFAISEVRKYVIDHLEKSDGIPVFDIFVVWSHQTQRKYKCMISTTLPDGMYYECTMLNGDKNKMYLNVYKKFEDKKIIYESRGIEMAKYRKKPVIIEAYQTDKEMIIHTLEGDMKASIGDYIITGVNGEKYPCKPDIFNKTYEKVEE